MFPIMKLKKTNYEKIVNRMYSYIKYYSVDMQLKVDML